ncbi:hypothetical protein [Domibacillus robiginosus]|uniref:hypothetical protein n=1 Tax=Domibacillus robiginosus TaxID=1071054 RepID=UPI00067D74B0|nr:hypothetical protein [Domibacillus robiginosus]
MIQGKKSSWLSYTAFILVILVAALSVIFSFVPAPFNLTVPFYIGILLVIILSLIALFRRHEKKILAVCNLILAFLVLGLKGVFFFTDFFLL